MTQTPPSPDEATNRAAGLLAQALVELQKAADGRSDGLATRAALEELGDRIESRLKEETEQRLALVAQLAGLATSLDRLVGHLQGLAELMANLMPRMTEPVDSPVAEPASPPREPSFQPGGEGVSLILTAVPSFQALMDLQKALTAMPEVSGVSVERFQEGESRLLVHLSGAVSAGGLEANLRSATGLMLVVEDSRPELSRLHLKVVPGS